MTARVLLAAALTVVSVLPAAAQSVSLTLRDGRVTLITQNATPAAILAEWARLGQVKVVDAERVPGSPLTLRLENVPEREALDIVLRSAAGYIAAPRSQAVAGNVSRFDRVIVMATSPGAATAAKPGGPSASIACGCCPGRAARARPGRGGGPRRPSPPSSRKWPTVWRLPSSPPRPPTSTTRTRSATSPHDRPNSRRPRRHSSSRRSSRRPARLGRSARRRPAPAWSRRPQPQGTPAGNGAAPANPYGLPAGQQPGSSPVASPLEPDRAKYINPYSPTPPRP